MDALPDIFLSYSREDQTVARRFAEALQRQGHHVWWDQTLNAGDAYDRITEQALESAKAVVVLWSRHSVESRWVRAEATTADRLGTLVPVMIEPCKRPIMFELTQSADLTHWNGNVEDPMWRGLLASLQRYLDPQGQILANPVQNRSRPQAAIIPRVPVALIAAALALTLAVGATWLLRGRVSTAETGNTAAAAAVSGALPPATLSHIPSIAVLPFTNMSSDKEQEYFSDGLSEELLNQLAQLGDLRVIGRTSSFAFKGRNEDLRQIGRTLGTDHILEGSVRKSGNRVRITAQLIDTADGSHLWSQSWDRGLDDIFAVQEEIARTVAGQMKVTLAGNATPARGTDNLSAFDAYLSGRALQYEGGPALFEGIARVEHAVALDPNFLQARMLLVRNYLGLMVQFPPKRAEARRKRDEQIDQVITRGPDSVQASLARALRAVDRRDYVEAMRQYERYGEQAGAALLRREFGYGQLLLALGQIDRGIGQLEAGRNEDPLNSPAALNLIVGYEIAGRFDRSAALLAQVNALPTVNVGVLRGTAVVMEMGRGDKEAARRALPEAIRRDPVGAAINAPMLEHLDDPVGARRALQGLIDDPQIATSMFGLSALAHWAAWFDDRELSIKALRRLEQLGLPLPVWGITLWRPASRGVREAPGFRRVLDDVGIVKYWRATGTWGDFCKPSSGDGFDCQ